MAMRGLYSCSRFSPPRAPPAEEVMTLRGDDFLLRFRLVSSHVTGPEVMALRALLSAACDFVPRRALVHRKRGSTRPRYRCSLGRPHRPQCRGVTPLFGVGRGSSRPSFHRLGPDVLLYADSTAEVKPSLPYPHPPSQEGGVAFGKIVVTRRTGVQLNARAPLFSGSASILPGAADTFWCLGCRVLAMPRFWLSLQAPPFRI